MRPSDHDLLTRIDERTATILDIQKDQGERLRVVETEGPEPCQALTIKVNSLERRVRKTEISNAKLIGWLTGIAATGGATGALAGKLVGWLSQ